MCDKKIIVDLLDMMLREEEEERPCFKRLKLAIKRDYNEYVENFDERK